MDNSNTSEYAHKLITRDWYRTAINLARRFGAKDSAEDIAHDALIRFLKFNWKHEGNPWGLFCTMLESVSVDRYRKAPNAPRADMPLELTDTTEVDPYLKMRRVLGLYLDSKDAAAVERLSALTDNGPVPASERKRRQRVREKLVARYGPLVRRIL